MQGQALRTGLERPGFAESFGCAHPRVLLQFLKPKIGGLVGERVPIPTET